MNSYEPGLVLLSVLVAILASCTALSLASHILKLSGHVPRYWLFAGSLSMGLGIWAMHFIGMLAFHAPVPLSYDIPVTIASLVVAVLASYVSLSFLRLGSRREGLIGSALAMGVGIVVMHYMGMEAIKMVPPIRYDPILVGLSIIIAIVASGGALWVASNQRVVLKHLSAQTQRIGSSVILGFAISGMHYTGMSAAVFDPASVCVSGPLGISADKLAILIAACAVPALILTIADTNFGWRMNNRHIRTELRLGANLFDAVTEGVMITDRNHVILSTNPSFSRISGYLKEDAIGKSLAILYPDMSGKAYRDAILNPVDYTGHWSGELSGCRRSGERFPAQTSVSAVRDVAGEITNYLVIFADITERIKSERALQDSKIFAHATIDAISAHICVLDETGRILAVNQAWRDFYKNNFSGRLDSSVGSNYLEICESATGSSAAEAASMADGIRSVLNGERDAFSLEYPCPSPSEQRWFLARVTPFPGDSHHVVITHQDITYRRQAEKALRESEERWKFALEGAGDGVWDWNIQTNKIFFSKRWKEMLGFAEDEIKDGFEEWETRAHPGDKLRVLADLQAYFEGESPVFASEHRMRCKDGNWKWILTRGMVISRDADGRPLRMIGTHADITDRKVAEEAQVRAVIEASPSATLLVGVDGIIRYANAVAEQVFDYTKAELIGFSFNALVPLGASAEFMSSPYLWRTVANLVLTGTRREGREFPVEVSLSPIRMGGQSVIIVSVNDITKRRQAEQERLRHEEQQRNTLVREVHHRIKNNLQGVVGLLNIYASQRPEIAPVISDIIGKVKSVAIVLGLQGLRDENDTRLCEITTEICKSAESLVHKALLPILDVNLEWPIRVAKEKAVPIALIINELVTNALKHSHPEKQHEPICVSISTDGETAILKIRNKSLPPPPGFNFDLGERLGTGLTLVRSMLPREGAELSLTFDSGTMTTELRLAPPVVTIQKV